MAVRNQPLTSYLEKQLQQGVEAVYGKGYKFKTYSGGQRAKGAKGTGGRAGSTRHDLGMASDGHIIGPDGKKLKGDQLAPMAQYWRAKGIGGVGLEMGSGGIHLDQHADRGNKKYWSYGNMTDVQRSALTAGNAGTLPQNMGQLAGQVQPGASATVPGLFNAIPQATQPQQQGLWHQGRMEESQEAFLNQQKQMMTTMHKGMGESGKQLEAASKGGSILGSLFGGRQSRMKMFGGLLGGLFG